MIQVMRELIILEEEVERLRNKLYRSIEDNHAILSGLEVVEASQELDKLMVQFLVIKSKTKENNTESFQNYT